MCRNIEEQNKKMIQQHEDILGKLADNNAEDAVRTDDSLYEPLKSFPLKTVAEFIELDDIANKEKRKKLVRIFDAKEYTCNCITLISSSQGIFQ